MAEAMTAPAAPADAFYRAALKILAGSKIPFMVAGAFALQHYTGIARDTKDFDVFCTPGDYPRLLDVLARAGYRTEVTDPNWLAKARHGDHFVDLIFNSRNDMVKVGDDWYERAPRVSLLGCRVRVLPREELLWSKLYIQDRQRYDGADVNHLILKQGRSMDWRRVLRNMDRDWELLLSHLINFGFVYPSEREAVPEWLLDELIERLRRRQELPVPKDRVCRGPLLTQHDYNIDIAEWGFKEK